MRLEAAQNRWFWAAAQSIKNAGGYHLQASNQYFSGNDHHIVYQHLRNISGWFRA
jgi:hypothetical protein